MFKIPSLKKAASKRRICEDLPPFDFGSLEAKEQIGYGSYGVVYKALHQKELVVAKKLIGESAEEESCFIKDKARLMYSLKHENVVGFKSVSSSPCAILIEYLYFDFSLFEISKQLSNLVEFLNYIDKIDAFTFFENDLILKMGYQISKGLEYLHSKGVAHRDLKAKNILVSNQHYCNLADEQLRFKVFSERPVICKLADFGESRSHLIQTAAVLHSKTKNIDRYTFSELSVAKYFVVNINVTNFNTRHGCYFESHFVVLRITLAIYPCNKIFPWQFFRV